jgi:hypothetical protein
VDLFGRLINTTEWKIKGKFTAKTVFLPIDAKFHRFEK